MEKAVNSQNGKLAVVPNVESIEPANAAEMATAAPTSISETFRRIPLEDGELQYVESWLQNPEEWYARLKTEVPWSPEKVKIFGTSPVLRRQTCNYGQHYDYNVDAKPPVEWSGAVLELKKILEDHTGRVFGQCACNFYPDGDTGISLHHDKNHPLLIASISFGAVRTMGFSRKGEQKIDKSLPVIPLASGSLLLVPQAVNDCYKHAIIEDKSVREPRISVTFREFASTSQPEASKEDTSITGTTCGTVPQVSEKQPADALVGIEDGDQGDDGFAELGKLPDKQLLERMESEVCKPLREAMTVVVAAQAQQHLTARQIIEANADLIREAHTRYDQPGQRVPVKGKPTFGKWLKQHLTIKLQDGTTTVACSDRYVRKVMADLNRQLQRIFEQIEPAKRTPRTKKTAPKLTETEADILAQRCVELSETLVGDSVEPLTVRVKRAISMAESVKEAVEDGNYDRFKVLPSPQLPPVAATPVPGPDSDSLQSLRSRISIMAEADDIAKAVQEYLDNLVDPLRENGLVIKVHVSAHRDGRRDSGLSGPLSGGHEGDFVDLDL